MQTASPVVVAPSSFVTAGLTAREVQTALENEFGLPTERAQLLATTFMNSGAGVTDGTKLMHALQIYGVAAFFLDLRRLFAEERCGIVDKHHDQPTCHVEGTLLGHLGRGAPHG